MLTLMKKYGLLVLVLTSYQMYPSFEEMALVARVDRLEARVEQLQNYGPLSPQRIGIAGRVGVAPRFTELITGGDGIWVSAEVNYACNDYTQCFGEFIWFSVGEHNHKIGFPERPIGQVTMNSYHTIGGYGGLRVYGNAWLSGLIPFFSLKAGVLHHSNMCIELWWDKKFHEILDRAIGKKNQEPKSDDGSADLKFEPYPQNVASGGAGFGFLIYPNSSIQGLISLEMILSSDLGVTFPLTCGIMIPF